MCVCVRACASEHACHCQKAKQSQAKHCNACRQPLQRCWTGYPSLLNGRWASTRVMEIAPDWQASSNGRGAGAFRQIVVLPLLSILEPEIEAALLLLVSVRGRMGASLSSPWA